MTYTQLEKQLKDNNSRITGTKTIKKDGKWFQSVEIDNQTGYTIIDETGSDSETEAFNKGYASLYGTPAPDADATSFSGSQGFTNPDSRSYSGGEISDDEIGTVIGKPEGDSGE